MFGRAHHIHAINRIIAAANDDFSSGIYDNPGDAWFARISGMGFDSQTKEEMLNIGTYFCEVTYIAAWGVVAGSTF